MIRHLRSFLTEVMRSFKFTKEGDDLTEVS